MRDWPEAVLFDFDGVIVNSEPLHFLAFQEVLAGEKIDLSEGEYYNELLGFDDKGAFEHVFKKRNRELDPKTFLRVMTVKSQAMMSLIHRRTYRALPGVEEFVRGLWRHVPLAICSGALREEIEVMLEGVALRDCFGVIVAAEDVTIGKPDPQGYLMALEMVSHRAGRTMKPRDVLVVEDAPSVIERARAAGFRTLGVAGSYTESRLAGADWVTKSLDPAVVHKAIPQLKNIE